MNVFTSLLNRRSPGFPLIAASAGVFLFCQAADSGKSKVQALTRSATESAQTAPIDRSQKRSDTAAAKASVNEQRKLIVYYFHGNFRCRSCTLIESLTKQAVESGFSEQLKSGRVELKVVNIETPGNEHFAEDYKLYTKSVILSDLKEGKETTWKNLDQVWTLLNDTGKFIEYIQKEVKTNL